MDPIGIVIKSNPANPRWKHIFDFKAKRMIFHEIDSLGVGDLVNFSTNAKADHDEIAFELDDDGQLKKLKNIPVVIHPRGRHDIPAWSPIVGVILTLLPMYNDLQHVVIEVTLDWIPFDECWCLAETECYQTEIDADQFIANAPFVLPPPRDPGAEKPRRVAKPTPVTEEQELAKLKDQKDPDWEPHRDKGHAIIFRNQEGGFLAWCGELKGTVEINQSSRNCGPTPCDVGSFLHVFLAHSLSVRGFPVVKEYIVVKPELDHTISTDKTGQRRIRVKTRVSWSGRFDIVAADRIYYGKSAFFGKCYDTYDLPRTKISSRSRGWLEVEITDTPHREQLMFQIMNVRHLDHTTRPAKEPKEPEIHPHLIAPNKPKQLTGFITQSKLRRNTVFCFQTGTEFYFQDQSRLWTGKFIKFMINANCIEPYQIEELKQTVVDRRWTPDMRPELNVRCSWEGRTTTEGYAILRSPDLCAEVIDRFNSTYLETDFKCWVYREHEPLPLWLVSDFVPPTPSASSCTQKKTELVYTGNKENGNPLLYSQELKIWVNDPDGITVKPGVYDRWILQEGNAPWRLAVTERTCEPKEEYAAVDCAAIAMKGEIERIQQQKVNDALAAILRLAELAPIQDAMLELGEDPRLAPRLTKLERLLFE